jgi:predicted nucleotidyltransferase/DNA-binding transcriptional ArsR family regulator
MTNLKYFITSKAKRNVLYLFLRDPGKRYYTREVARLTGEPLNAVRRELGYLEKAGLLSSRVQGNLKYYEVVKSFPMLGHWRKIILEYDAARPPATVNIPPSHVTASEGKQSPRATDVIAESEVKMQSTETKHIIAMTEAFKHVPLEDGDKPIIPGVRVVPNHRPQPLPDVIELPAPATAGDAAANVVASIEAPEQSPEPKPRTILTLQSVVNHLSEQLKDETTINLALIHGDAARSERIPESGIDLLIVGDMSRDMVMELIATFEDTTGININLTSMTRSDFDYRNAKGDAFVRRIWGEKKLVVKGRQ